MGKILSATQQPTLNFYPLSIKDILTQKNKKIGLKTSFANAPNGF
jgi:hypothetical protein